MQHTTKTPLLDKNNKNNKNSSRFYRSTANRPTGLFYVVGGEALDISVSDNKAISKAILAAKTLYVFTTQKEAEEYAKNASQFVYNSEMPLLVVKFKSQAFLTECLAKNKQNNTGNLRSIEVTPEDYKDGNILISKMVFANIDYDAVLREESRCNTM